MPSTSGILSCLFRLVSSRRLLSTVFFLEIAETIFLQRVIIYLKKKKIVIDQKDVFYSKFWIPFWTPSWLSGSRLNKNECTISKVACVKVLDIAGNWVFEKTTFSHSIYGNRCQIWLKMTQLWWSKPTRWKWER